MTFEGDIIMVKMLETEYDKIVELYRNKHTQKEIAEQYGVCVDTIRKILKESGVERNTKIGKKDYQNIVDMYKNGMTQQSIADIYNVNSSRISSIVNKYGDINFRDRMWLTMPETEYQNIVDMYVGGMTQSEIANHYNCSASLVSSILKKQNIKTRSGGSKNDADVVAQWVDMYKNGYNLIEIAKSFDATPHTVSTHLKENGVFVDRFTYHFNEHYFDVIDSEDKAYILGMLWADGHNRVSNGSIILSLQEDDVELLEKINSFTENERPLRIQKLSLKNPNFKDQYRLILQSKYTSNILESYGMVQSKSLVLEFPRCINRNLYSHFIRGYFDGDGCLTLSNNNRSGAISMIGTRMLLNVVAEIIRDNVGVDVAITRDGRAKEPICELRCRTRDYVKKILDWMYADSTLYMKRKYDKYQLFLQNINNSDVA